MAIIDLNEVKLEELTEKELKALERAGVIKKTEDGEYIIERKLREKDADHNRAGS